MSNTYKPNLTVVPAKARLKRGDHNRKIEFLLSPALSIALDDYRATKRPIPTEADAIRWLIAEALHGEGIEVTEPQSN